jgi:hypothetical protein
MKMPKELKTFLKSKRLYNMFMRNVKAYEQSVESDRLTKMEGGDVRNSFIWCEAPEPKERPFAFWKRIDLEYEDLLERLNK